MEILILGGDLRYLEIIETLNKKYNVDLIGYKYIYINEKVKNIDIKDIKINKYDIIIFPINGVMKENLITCRFNNYPIKLPDNLLTETKENALIFSGIPTENLTKMLEIANRKCIYLMKDKEVIKQNAIPTVEGIIADIINNTEKTIKDSNVLIFGYGNIGTLLTTYLKMLGSNITVAIKEEKDKTILDKKQIKNFYSNNELELIKEIKNTDIIINTVPETVINDNQIKHINKNAYVLDIASHPYGINQEVLDEYFIKNKLYLGIPGKVAPITSGKILTKKINEYMEDV